MKVPYDEGLANHIGPESSICRRRAVSEPLTGESAEELAGPYPDNRGVSGLAGSDPANFLVL